MSVDYRRPPMGSAKQKHELQHSRIVQRRKRAKVQTARTKAKQTAKARDAHRCRWPRADHDTPGHVCVGPLESAHQVAIGMGGEKQPNARTRVQSQLTVCAWIHQLSPDALERHGRSWKGLEPGKGSNGPIAFRRRDPKTGKHVEIARERVLGILDTRR